MSRSVVCFSYQLSSLAIFLACGCGGSSEQVEKPLVGAVAELPADSVKVSEEDLAKDSMKVFVTSLSKNLQMFLDSLSVSEMNKSRLEGMVVEVTRRIGKPVAYDIEKSNSVVSPYTATISFSVVYASRTAFTDEERSEYERIKSSFEDPAEQKLALFAKFPLAAPEGTHHIWGQTYSISAAYGFQENKWVLRGVEAKTDKLAFEPLFPATIEATTD